VGVISAQKNTLRLPTAWDANMPTMENAMENLSLTLSLIPGELEEGDSEWVRGPGISGSGDAGKGSLGPSQRLPSTLLPILLLSQGCAASADIGA
jgi:hypothetical protein